MENITPYFKTKIEALLFHVVCIKKDFFLNCIHLSIDLSSTENLKATLFQAIA